MDENATWRMEVISRCMEARGYTPARAMVRTAEGSPYSWTGSPSADAPAAATGTTSFGVTPKKVPNRPLNLVKRMAFTIV